MNQFAESLSGTDKVLYQTSYDFQIKYCDATPEQAHQAGLEKIKQTKKLVDKMSKPQTYINLATGKKIKCTESQLIAKFS